MASHLRNGGVPRRVVTKIVGVVDRRATPDAVEADSGKGAGQGADLASFDLMKSFWPPSEKCRSG